MAITPPGGSAASRFRPRGTALGGTGLRRSLLVEEEGTEEATTQEEVQASTQELSAREFVDRAQAAQAAVNTIISQSESTPQVASVVHVTSEDENTLSSTSTGQSHLSGGTTTTPKKRGRPPKSTHLAVTPGSQQSSGDNPAYSVADARARMREIEQMAKAMRTNYNNDINALAHRYKQDSTELQLEYQSLSQLILEQTFGL